jgi:hypothetical protein
VSEYKPGLFFIPALFLLVSFAAPLFAAPWCWVWLVAWVVLAFAAATYIAGRGHQEGQEMISRARAEEERYLAGLNTEQLDTLKSLYPELRLDIIRGGHIAVRLGDTGVSQEWFGEFMDASNSHSTIPVREYSGHGRERERANWHAVTAYLDRCGMFYAEPRGAETFRWREGCFEFCRRLAGLSPCAVPELPALVIPAQRTGPIVMQADV